MFDCGVIWYIHILHYPMCRASQYGQYLASGSATLQHHQHLQPGRHQHQQADVSLGTMRRHQGHGGSVGANWSLSFFY